MPEIQSLRASVVLAAYAESVIDAGRVLVVGEATTPLVERLLERGARLVHVVDADPTRVAEAATRNSDGHVSFAPLGPGGLPIRDGAFDVAIVENLATFSEPAQVLRQVQRAIGVRGTALVASPNPDCRARLLPVVDPGKVPDYYAFYDLVTDVFDDVRMLGQAPFVGYAVVDFAPEEEIEPILDTEFVPGGAEEAEWFVAVAAGGGASFEAFTVVQLSAREVTGVGRSDSQEQQLRAARAAERQARDRLAELEAELLRRQAGAPAKERADRLAKLEAELTRHEQWSQKLEDRAATADARADAVQAELDAAEERLVAMTRDLAGARADLEAERRRCREAVSASEAARTERAQLAAAVAAAQARAQEAEAALAGEAARRAADSARLAELQGIDEQAATDIASLERQLLERGAVVQSLEQAAREAARAGAELIAEVERLRTEQETLALRETAEDLGRRNVELVADLQAAHWSLAAARSELARLRSMTATAATTVGTSAAAPDAVADGVGEVLSIAEAAVGEPVAVPEQPRAQGPATMVATTSVETEQTVAAEVEPPTER